MSEPVTTPRELLAARLRQMLWIELKLADEVLPQLRESARSTDLVWGLERHQLETEGHVERLRHVLAELGVHAEPEPTSALPGLVKEHEELVKRIAGGDRLLLDLAHADAAAATEHLEMAAYNSLASLAEALGEEEVGIALRDLEEQEEHALEAVGRATAKLLAEKVGSARS